MRDTGRVDDSKDSKQESGRQRARRQKRVVSTSMRWCIDGKVVICLIINVEEVA